MIRLGYAAINTELREWDIFTSRSLILKTAKEGGFEAIKLLILQNLDDFMKILIFNEAHGIRFYRMSSNMFPHLDNPKLGFTYPLKFFKEPLKKIGKYAKAYQHRLTLHPGQYTQLSSPRAEVVEQSIIDLKNHYKLMHYLDLTPVDGAVIILHGGGTFGDKAKALTRWEKVFLSLPVKMRSYLVLENDENSYGVMDLLPFCERLQIPFCLDIFHNQISPDRVEITDKLMGRIIETWKKRGIIPKIHISQQDKNSRRGAHSSTLSKIPRYYLTIPRIFQTPIDFMLEVKDKEKSVFKIYEKYFKIHMENGKVTYSIRRKYV